MELAPWKHLSFHYPSPSIKSLTTITGHCKNYGWNIIRLRFRAAGIHAKLRMSTSFPSLWTCKSQDCDGRSILISIRTDICHSYGPDMDESNKKGWPALLAEIKKVANQQGFSLVASGGHKGATHCLRCCRGILAYCAKTNTTFDMEEVFSSDVWDESLVNSKRSNTRVNGRSTSRKISSNRPV